MIRCELKLAAVCRGTYDGSITLGESSKYSIAFAIVAFSKLIMCVAGYSGSGGGDGGGGGDETLEAAADWP